MNQTTVDHINRLRSTKKGYIKYIMQQGSCDRKSAQVIADRCLRGEEPARIELNPTAKPETPGLVFTDKYTYNPVLDQYVVKLTSYGGNYVCPGAQHRGMQLAYSRHSKDTIADICQTYAMDRSWFSEYKTKMGWTKTMLPITREEVGSMDQADSLKVLEQRRIAKLQQEANKRDWGRVQEESNKWNEFALGKLDPFVSALSRITLPVMKPLPTIQQPGKPVTKNTLLIGLSDLHFGGKALASELFNGRDFNAKVIADIVDLYAVKLQQETQDRTYRFGRVVVCMLGDILHSLSGETEKGTQLEFDVIREEQFELAMNSLVRFLTRMVEVFGKVEVHCVKGNHAGPDDYILCLALKSFFRQDARFQFHLYKARTALFRVNNAAIMLDHGDSDSVKAKIPPGGAGQEAYVQGRFMQRSDEMQGINTRILIQGDRHKCKYEEFRNFEYFLFSSPVSGDHYADHLNLSSKPRQNCLVINDAGVKELLSFYF